MISIGSTFTKFLREKKLQGLSKVSLKDYEIIIGLFVAYVGIDTNIFDIDRDLVDAYIEYQVDRDIALSTFATYVRNTKIFLMWLENKYNIDVQASEIKIPKSPKLTLHIYSVDDINLIFSSIRFDEKWMEYRNKSMVALMLDSGLRQSEICHLKQSDIDFCNNVIKVHGKGEKERHVPLGLHSKKYIVAYLENCPYKSKNLFVSIHGEPITPNTLKQMASKMAKDLPFKFSCHKLRHNFATNFCMDQFEEKGNMDAYSLMILMGHSNMKTTERYLHWAKEIVCSKQSVSHLDRILV